MPSATVGLVAEIMEALAPLHWAESWDNVGLQVGEPGRPAGRILVALELTDDVLDEAVAVAAELVVVHHPPIFQPLKSLRLDTPGSRRLERLILERISVYAAHTNFDQAAGGTNDTLAAVVGLSGHEVLEKAGESTPGTTRGHGRIGRLDQPVALHELVARLKAGMGLSGLRVVGDLSRTVTSVAVAAGSGVFLAPTAVRLGADVLVTGDVGHHDAWDAFDLGLAVIDVGHFSSENVVVGPLAAYLRQQMTERGVAAEVLEAQTGRDPFAFR